MSILALSSGFLSCFCVVHVVLFSSSITFAGGHSDLHEKIKYHLRELNTGLQELGSSQGHRLHKRSTLSHDEIIYSSLVAFCRQLDSGDGLNSTLNNTNTGNNNSNHPSDGRPADPRATGTRLLKSLELPGPKKYDVPNTAPISTWPHLFPLKVQAQRDGAFVWLVFDVVHTSPVSVSRVNSFDTAKTFIEYPQDLATTSSDSSRASSSPSPVLSKVRLMVEAMACANASRPYDDHSANIGFVNRGGPPSYMVTTSINLCMFDYYQNGTDESGEDKWVTTRHRIVREIISPPFFQIAAPDPGDEIVIHKGSNVELDFLVHLKGYLGMQIDVKIWDRRNRGEILKSKVRLSTHNGTAKVFPESTNSAENLLSVEILEQTKIRSQRNKGNSSKETDGEEQDIIKVKMRVTIDTSHGRRSGRLLINYHRHFHSDRKQPVVEFLSVGREISLKLPHKTQVLPKNYVDITDPGRAFECDSKGIRHYSKQSNNCTIHCYAHGTDIKNIFITNTRYGRPLPVRSVSEVYEGSTAAFAMIDVGPASKDVEGTYKCVAVTYNGRAKNKEIKLFTSLFTRILPRNTSVYQFSNSTARVVCSAFGAQPLNMSLFAERDDGASERIDNKTSNTREITVRGHYSNLTVYLSSDQLRRPVFSLQCEASGERGSDRHLTGLDGYLYNSTFPIIDTDPTYSNVVVQNNGTVVISCESSGAVPLKFVITDGTSKDAERVDDKPGAIRYVSASPGGERLTLTVNERYFSHQPTWAACKVSNAHGEAWYDFHESPNFPHGNI